MDQDEVVYEPPTLVEVGDFAALTRGVGVSGFDFSGFFSDFFYGS